MNWLLERLKEKTTWLGLFTILSTLGVSLAPELKEAIIGTGLSLISLVLVITKDKK
jgi:hypothetical protein